MKLLFYVLICSYLFARLDWAVVHYTRTVNPAWLEWMHAHERTYATITRAAELVICAPAMFLKPLFYQSLLDVEAGGEEQEAIVHEPEKPSLKGFWNMPVRGQGYVFVSWPAWFVYWLVPAFVWVLIARRFM